MDLLDKAEKILIVEDEDQIRSLLRCVFEEEGYAVSVAESADLAIDILCDNSFDLIISDVMMPGTNGIEFLEQIKEVDPEQEFIIMTGFPKVSAAVQAIKMGAYDYMSKPFEVLKVVAQARGALEHRKQRLEAKCHRVEADSKSTRVLAGYGIESVLGEGMMGIVFKVKKLDDHESSFRALKIIKNQPLSGESNDALERFFKEAETASRMCHDNIIQVYEHGYAREENIPYMVMEYFESISLKKRMASPLSDAEKLSIFKQIARALQAAHSQGVVHRDVKPENILINDQLQVKLSDFGIVQLPSSEQTNIAKIVGTPYYLAPEGYMNPKVDARADLYSLGTLAYELYLGVRPFDGDTITALGYQIQTENPPAPSKLNADFPMELQAILERLLKKEPKDRFQTAIELLEELEKIELSSLKKKSFLSFGPSWDTF